MTTSGPVASEAPTPVHHDTDLARMWFGFLGAPAAWSISEIVPYILIAHACYPNLTPMSAPVPPAARGVALAVALLALAIALAALAASTRDTVHLFASEKGYAAAAAESNRSNARRYLAFAGILFGAVFASLIIYNLIALIGEPVCAVG